MNKRIWIDYTKVRETLDFETVLKHYNIEYQTGRDEVRVRCHFHKNDNDPSLNINLPEKKFKCFGCDAQGNILSFIALKEGLDPKNKEHLYKTAEIAVSLMGMELSDFPKSNSKKIGAESRSKRVNGQTRPKPKGKAEKADNGAESVSEADAKSEPPKTNPLFDRVLSLKTAHPFLEARGITPEVAEKFELGYCSAGMMKKRIAIMLRNEDGERVGYCGRWAVDDPLPEGQQKYKLPYNFHKTLILWNLHRAVELGRKHLVIVEGFWSVIRLHQAGIPTVSTLGSDISAEQVQMIKNAGYRHVTVILDGDEAGRLARPAFASEISKVAYVRTLELPDGVKPDTMDDEWLDRIKPR